MENWLSVGHLRKRFEQGTTLMAPGVYDALSAKVAATCGAEAVYMTGFGVAGSTLGMPDVGLLSATEMADRARAIAGAAAPVPLIADADSGYGGVLNVARMTRLYEQSGVQCIQLEDQIFAKRCGHMARKEIVGREEAVSKIAAAVAARTSKDFLIMARTDARSVVGFDEALTRADSFLEAGADLLFVEAPESESELIKIADTFKGAYLVANMVEDGNTPYLSVSDLQELGFALVIYPVSSLLVISKTLQETFNSMLQHGQLPIDTERLRFQQYNSMIGLDKLLPEAIED